MIIFAAQEESSMSSRSLPYPVFDIDNHMYETTDALTKYLPKEHRGKVGYVEVNGRPKLVHQLEAGSGILIRGNDIHCFAHKFAEVEAFGVVTEEVILGATWPGDARESRVGDHMADVVLDDELGAAIDLDVADLSAMLLR
ncbi:hypothetical protein A5626_16615 [Mycobacterium marseillense]|nr:hypothetical protein A5626_16615 [Mycobacterium marseillense]